MQRSIPLTTKAGGAEVWSVFEKWLAMGFFPCLVKVVKQINQIRLIHK
jgi:hypothetical protein